MKRYIKCAESVVSIPSECQKYYKVDKSQSQSESDELADEFASFGLEFLYPVEAKSRYADIFDIADIYYASVCRRKDGSIGVYVFGDDKVYDLSAPNKIKYIIEDVKADM